MSKAADTRLSILHKAFELIYRNGFQATSIDTILASTQVTKGAFFYHFRNKEDMGLALINEVIHPGMHEGFVQPLTDSANPAADIYAMMKHLLLTAPVFQTAYGCPAVNLVNELSAANDSLAKALHQVMNQCQRAVQDSIRRGIALGQINETVDAEQVATFIMVGYSGVRNMGKLFGPACYHDYLHELKRYLDQLA